MERMVNLLTVSPLDDVSRKQIADVGGRLRIEEVSPLIVAEKKGDASAKQKLDPLLARSEVIFGRIWHLPRNLISRAPRLKWLQVTSAGVDLLPEDILRSRVTVTSTSGIHATPIGEFTMLMMLGLVKKLPQIFQWKQEKKWQRSSSPVLRGKTVGILGLGQIGREVARLCKAFGMNVMATRRASGPARARYVGKIYPRDQLPALLAESDFVVIALPLTAETKGLIGEKELRLMKPGACLINIARGPIIDEEALVRALEQKWIAGAGLDVFAKEPLSPDSKLWNLPNVILSPHVAGLTEDYEFKATAVFCKNLKRYVQGKRLLNVVNKKKGY